MNHAAQAEQSTRQLLSKRPTWMLLTMWEVADATRDDFRRADCLPGYEAAAHLVRLIIDELDGRYPHVIPRWAGLAERGVDADLATMFSGEIR